MHLRRGSVRRSLRAALLLALCAPCASAAAGSGVLFVDDDAEAGGDGASWATAYHDLQDALDEAAMPGSDVGEIWIAAGSYRPDRQTGDRTLSFQLVNDVALLGGFAGDEVNSDQRDPSVNLTILTGDLNDDDDSGGSNAENAYHVVDAAGTNATAIMDGLVIRAGHADGPTPADVGAGLYSSMSSPTIRRCTFEDNVAGLQGAGVYNLFGDPSFSDCRFENNEAVTGSGGGLFSWLGRPVVVNCDFLNNTADSAGGGLTLQSGNLHLTRCRFIGNVAGDNGGGLYKAAGDVVITNCLFLGNDGTIGGGIYDDGDETTTSLINCLVQGNTAAGYAAGVYTDGTMLILDSTISHNANDFIVQGAGVFSLQGDLLLLANSIVWGNDAGGVFDQSAQIYVNVFDIPTVNYSCIQGWNGAWGGVGNHGEDPLFIDVDGADDELGTIDDDARLDVGSPCTNTGDNTLLPVDVDDLDDDGDFSEALPLDLDEQARISESIVDMGAYERPGDVMGDLDGDGEVGPADLAILLGSWGACPACAADLNGDDVVGPTDLAILLGNWG